MSNCIHSDTKDPVTISSRRFEQSPYFSRYANEKTVLGVYAGRFYPVDNGEDSTATYWKLRREAVLYDVPEKPWQIEGPDAVPFLERVFARRIGDLKPGRGRYAIACTESGGTFMDGVLFRIDDDVFWYVQPEGELLSWFMAHSAGYDVSVSDPRSRVLQIQGPHSPAIMSDLTVGAIDSSMKYFHSGHFDVGGQTVYISRTGWTGELGYEIYSNAETDHLRLWRDVTSAGERHGMVFGSTKSMGVRRIEAGILDNLTDFDTTMTPYQAGLGNFIDLDKEGFVGREALLDADRRTTLLGVRCPSGIPNYRGNVWVDGTPVGSVTAAAWSPTLDCGIGYVRFHDADDWVGRPVTVTTEHDLQALGEVVTLPFFDGEKLIPRGLPSPA
jgi:glycine cleavage system aminomethyltransferase T